MSHGLKPNQLLRASSKGSRFHINGEDIPYVRYLEPSKVAHDVIRVVHPDIKSPSAYEKGQVVSIFVIVPASEDEYETWKLLNA